MSVATVLKSRWIRTPVIGLLALSAAIFAGLLLGGLAEAQEKDRAGTNTTTVVEPGESLWTIAQARLGPDASSQQVAAETQRIYMLNREQIGEDPNLIFPDQELLLARKAESVEDARTSSTETPAASEASSFEGSSSMENDASSYPEPKYSNRLVSDVLTLLASLGLFLFAMTVAAFAVSKLLRRRSWLREYHQTQKEREEQATEVEAFEQAEVGTSLSATSAGPASTGLADLSEGETILLSRAFLERCLEERLAQDEPIVLDAREREFLELVARSATFRDEIVVPKELLEAFLAKN